ncbi:hypothetical protein [Paraliomyxa miuraensis]|uniref:hypothetical protein n=1 Tax=Paraliomyxa miuraensis TaxID=376150 RepID=UPI00225468F9|nr:hypothetical protein [Paraliomyxa miuraensis]MCX4242227.1 hypothetical protein [Paraliomyxa miuraensis]
MKTMAGCALGLCVAVGCSASAELEPAPASVPLESAAYVAAPICGPAKVSTLRELLPNVEILGALEIDVQHLQRGALFPEVERTLLAQSPEVLDAMNECGLPLASVEGLVAGFSDHDDVMMGIRAKGVGEAKTLDCLAKKIEGATGKSPWSRVTKGCATTLEMPDGDGKGFVVSRDVVVFASKSLQGAVDRRIQGKDESALAGRLGWVRGEVDTSSTAWMAANLPSGSSAGLGPAFSGLSRVGMSVDATRGLGLRMGAGFGSAAEAKAAAAELEGQLGQVKAMLPMLGLSSTVGDSIEVAAKGNVLKLGMFLAPSDLEALRQMAGGGSSTGGSPPPPPSRRFGM